MRLKYNPEYYLVFLSLLLSSIFSQPTGSLSLSTGWNKDNAIVGSSANTTTPSTDVPLPSLNFSLEIPIGDIFYLTFEEAFEHNLNDFVGNQFGMGLSSCYRSQPYYSIPHHTRVAH